MPGTRFSPVDSYGSTRTRSGRMTTRDSPRVAISPRERPQREVAESRAARHRRSPASTRHRHQVRDAEEVGDEHRPRLLVHLRRRRHLLDMAVRHHGDPVGHRQRLFLVVRDVDERDPELLLDRLQLDLQRLAQLRVERAEWLVEQQNRRVQDEGARERDALLLATRELRRPPLARARRAGPLRAPSATRSCISCSLRRGAGAARRRRCRRRRGAGRARSSGRPCSPCACAAASPPCRSPSSRMRPLSGRSKPAIRRSVVVLPQPDGPSSEKNSPGVDLQVDAVDRGDVGEALPQLDELDRAVCHAVKSPGPRCSAPRILSRLLCDVELLVDERGRVRPRTASRSPSRSRARSAPASSFRARSE